MRTNRVGLWLATFALAFVAATSLGGQTSGDFDTGTLTVRQVWDNLTTLYGTGHSFTGDEFSKLKDYRAQLVDASENDLALRLDLLMLAAARENEKADSALHLDQGSAAWKAVQAAEKRRVEATVWELARNIGLSSMALSTTSALSFAALLSRSEGHTSASEAEFLTWGLIDSVVAMILSIVPLLTGEFSR